LGVRGEKEKYDSQLNKLGFEREKFTIHRCYHHKTGLGGFIRTKGQAGETIFLRVKIGAGWGVTYKRPRNGNQRKKKLGPPSNGQEKKTKERKTYR